MVEDELLLIAAAGEEDAVTTVIAGVRGGRLARQRLHDVAQHPIDGSTMETALESPKTW